MKRLLALLLVPALAPALPAQVKQTATLKAPAPVARAVVCPGGSEVAGLTRDGKLYLWSVASGEPVLSADLSEEHPRSLACGVGWLAAGTRGGMVLLLERASGAVKGKLAASTHTIAQLAFSPDSRLLAVAPAEVPAQLWEAGTGKQIAELKTDFGGSTALAFSRDGERLASADEDTVVRIYDARGRLQSTASDLLLETFTAAFTPDGKQLVVSGGDKTVSFLDAGSGRILRQSPPAAEPIYGLVMAGRQNALATFHFDAATMSQWTSLVWNLASGKTGPAPFGEANFLDAGPGSDESTLVLTQDGERGVAVWSWR